MIASSDKPYRPGSAVSEHHYPIANSGKVRRHGLSFGEWWTVFREYALLIAPAVILLPPAIIIPSAIGGVVWGTWCLRRELQETRRAVRRTADAQSVAV